MELIRRPDTFKKLQEQALIIPTYGIDVLYRKLADGSECWEKCGYFPHKQKNWYAIKGFVAAWGDGRVERVYPIYKGVKEMLEAEGYHKESSQKVYNPFFWGAEPVELNSRIYWQELRRLASS